MKRPVKNLYAAFLALFFFLASAGPTGAQTTVYINPPLQNVSLFSGATTASVNVSISGVSNLYGYQYDILYTSNPLNITAAGITEGPFLKMGQELSTYCIAADLSTPGLIKNTACTRMGETSASGSGNLTRLVFQVNLSAPPSTAQIRIVNSKLSNINSQPITHTIANGTVYTNTCINGEQKSCGSNIGECRSGTETCTNNQWGSCTGGVSSTSEICDGKDNNCNGQADENAAGTDNLSRSCSLFHSGTCAQGTEKCNGTQYLGCPVPQTEICYNSIDEDCDGADSSCKGDIASATGNSPDGCIDISDLVSIGMDFGKTSAFNNPNTDIDKNGVVDIFDLVYIGKDFDVGCS